MVFTHGVLAAQAFKGSLLRPRPACRVSRFAGTRGSKPNTVSAKFNTNAPWVSHSYVWYTLKLSAGSECGTVVRNAGLGQAVSRASKAIVTGLPQEVLRIGVLLNNSTPIIAVIAFTSALNCRSLLLSGVFPSCVRTAETSKTLGSKVNSRIASITPVLPCGRAVSTFAGATTAPLGVAITPPMKLEDALDPASVTAKPMGA